MPFSSPLSLRNERFFSMKTWIAFSSSLRFKSNSPWPSYNHMGKEWLRVKSEDVDKSQERASMTWAIPSASLSTILYLAVRAQQASLIIYLLFALPGQTSRFLHVIKLLEVEVEVDCFSLQFYKTKTKKKMKIPKTLEIRVLMRWYIILNGFHT